VTVRTTSWRGALWRAVWLAIITTLTPLPAAASDALTAEKAPTIKASMERIVARDLTAAPAPPATARSARQGPAPGSPSGFFKSRAGMVALVAMVAGAGYALYSASHDRIHSPAKN
jgi:hypothetical protein